MSTPSAGGFDFSKLSTGTKVAAGGAILYLISMFLPWFSVDLGPLGSVTLPEDATDRGVEAAAETLTIEVLAELLAAVKAIRSARKERQDR